MRYLHEGDVTDYGDHNEGTGIPQNGEYRLREWVSKHPFSKQKTELIVNN